MKTLREAAQAVFDNWDNLSVKDLLSLSEALDVPDAEPYGWVDAFGNYEKHLGDWMVEETGWIPVYTALTEPPIPEKLTDEEK